MLSKKILKTNKKRLSEGLVLNANEPNFVNFALTLAGEKLFECVEVEQEVRGGEILASSKRSTLISSVSGKIVDIKEVQNPDESYSLNIKIKNSFKKENPLKKLINPTQEELIKRVTQAGILSLQQLDNKKELIISTLDTKYTLGLNEFLFKKYFFQILKGAQLISKFFGKQVKFLVEKSLFEKTFSEVQKLNLKGVEVVNKGQFKNHQTLYSQVALDLYDSVNFGNFKTHHFIAVAGQSIKKPSYYLVTLGTSIEEAMELAGGLKHTYEEIERFKEDALIALNDEVEIKKDIKNAPKSEKDELKKLLAQKKIEARNTIFKYFSENQKKYSLCLSNIVMLTTNKAYSAKHLENSITEEISALLFLSNDEYKNRSKNIKNL